MVDVERKPILSLVNISKKFPGVQALDKVSLDIFPGEIHAVLGENGAGKSTLMKILSGIIPNDSGEIYLDGKKVQFRNPREAIEAGIVLVHQELSLIPTLSVAENIFLGRWPKRGVSLDWRGIYKEAERLLQRFDVRVDIRTPVRELSVAEQQIVEILKAISQPHIKVLLLDEPTSALTDEEIERLFKILFEIKKENKAIIFISHKIGEALRIADRITVIKDGKKVITEEKEKLTEKGIIFHMTGRVLEAGEKEHVLVENGKKPVLSLKNFSVGIVKNVNLDIYKGETLAIFGLMGSGRTTLAKGLFGLEKFKGELFLEGKRVEISSPAEAINLGIGYIPEDRRSGLVYQFPVSANITLAILKEISKRGVLDLGKEVEISKKYVEILKIKTPSVFQKVLYLSGGNQQKVLIARWLVRNLKVLIMDEPTRGIDVGAKFEIREFVKGLAKSGMAIIYITSEAPEALEIGDRIAIMRNGKITKVFENRGIEKSDLLAEVGGTVVE